LRKLLPQPTRPKRRFTNTYVDKETFIAFLLRTGNEGNLRRMNDISAEEIERVKGWLVAIGCPGGDLNGEENNF
jgi:hypothetical protein